METTKDEEERAQARYELARRRFDPWAALDGQVLPSDPVDATQVMMFRWREANFPGADDVSTFAGIVEEAAELATPTDINDALKELGDVMILCGHLLLGNRMAIGTLIEEASARIGEGDPDPGTPVLLALGKLARCVVKRRDGIRGMEDVEAYRRALSIGVASVLRAAAGEFELTYGMGAVLDAGDLAMIYATRALEVRDRDPRRAR